MEWSAGGKEAEVRGEGSLVPRLPPRAPTKTPCLTFSLYFRECVWGGGGGGNLGTRLGGGDMHLRKLLAPFPVSTLVWTVETGNLSIPFELQSFRLL